MVRLDGTTDGCFGFGHDRRPGSDMRTRAKRRALRSITSAVNFTARDRDRKSGRVSQCFGKPAVRAQV